LRGCNPKKALVGAGEVLDWLRRMRDKGLEADQARIAWPALMRFKRTFTDPVPKSREEGFAAAGIQPFHGHERFVGPNTLSVGADVLEGRHVVVASGARPAPLGIPGENLFTYSEGFFELEALLHSMILVGGGYIAFEFAHLAARDGVVTRILHRGKRPLELFDADLAARLLEHSRSLGSTCSWRPLCRRSRASRAAWWCAQVHAASERR
jgi:glutathione reductase (NADPH)